MRVQFGDFVLDTDRHELLRRGDPVHLPPKIFQLLQILAEERPRAVAQQDLYDRLWPDTFVEKSNLHNLIYQLRDALDDGEQTIIRTVYGFGFSFAAPVSDAAPPALWQIVIAGREFDLHDGENLVGRERGASVRIDSGSISRHHARITVSPSGVTLEDLDSKNGTYIDGVKLTGAASIHEGQTIVLGDASILFRRSRGSSTVTSSRLKRSKK